MGEHSLITATAQACAKAILVGEHFVVWGGTAVAFPVHSARMSVTVSATPQTRNTVLEAPEGEDFLKATRKAARALLRDARYGLRVDMEHNFPLASGLGGSASYSVALSRALMQLGQGEIDEDLVAQTALDLEKVFHGSPSGIDSTTIAFESPCFIKTGNVFYVAGDSGKRPKGPVAGFVDMPAGGTFLLADSGERSTTRGALTTVNEIVERPGGEKVIERLTAVSETISLQAASAMRKGDYEYVGLMMVENQYLLRGIGVSTQRTEELCSVAQDAGALGAKLTGSGMGGFVLALTHPDLADRVSDALRRHGAKTIFRQETKDL